MNFVSHCSSIFNIFENSLLNGFAKKWWLLHLLLSYTACNLFKGVFHIFWQLLEQKAASRMQWTQESIKMADPQNIKELLRQIFCKIYFIECGRPTVFKLIFQCKYLFVITVASLYIRIAVYLIHHTV